MTYLLRATNAANAWRTRHFRFKEVGVRAMPAMGCRTCNLFFPAPALAHAGGLLDAHPEQAAIAACLPGLKVWRHEPPPIFRPDEFAEYREFMRQLLGLDKEFPAFSGARIEPLTIRWTTPSVPNVVITSAQDGVVVVKEAVAEAIARDHPNGIVWVPIRHHPTSIRTEPMMEMVVTGATEVDADETAVAQAIAEDFGDGENVAFYTRCRTCRRFPFRQKYLFNTPLRPTTDAFRLADFRGIYVTAALKATLQRFDEGALVFEALPPVA